MASDICYVCGTRNMRGSVCLTCCPDGDPRLKPANTPVAPVSPDATGKCGELVTPELRQEIFELAKDLFWSVDGNQRLWSGEEREIYGLQAAMRIARSQADELLAAERARYVEASQRATNEESLKDTMHRGLRRWKGRAEKAEADNAALTERVKELEQINANLMGDDEDKPRYTTKRLKLEIARATGALEAKLSAAQKALEPFAREADNWSDTVPDSHRSLCTEPGSKTVHPGSETIFTVGDLRQARAVLGGKQS